MAIYRAALLVLVALGTFRGAVAVEQSTPIALRVVAAPPATSIQRTIDQPSFEHELLVEATQAVKDARAEATDLVGPKRIRLGCIFASQPCGAPVSIGAGEAKRLDLAADVDAVGTYTAVLSVVVGETRQNLVLSVTRSVTPFPLELVSTVPTAIARDGAVNLLIPLQEKTGRAAVLNLPSLTLGWHESGKTDSRAAAFTTRMKVGDTPVAAPWSIGARQAPVLQVGVDGLEGAGEYSGKLRLTSPESNETLDVPIVITQKDSSLLAAILIATGALLSFALRTYLKTVRPRLVQLRAGAQLALDLEKLRNDMNRQFAPLQAAETAVVDGLLERLDSISDQIEVRTEAETQAVLDELDTKLSLVRRWINARRRAETLRNPPAEVGAGLVQVGDFLGRPGAAGAADIATTLKGIEDKIVAAAQAEARERVDKLRKAIETSAFLEDRKRAELSTALDTAASNVDAPEQRARLDQLEGDLVDAQIAGFTSRIGQTQTPPLGFELDQWSRLVNDLRARLDAAKAAPVRARAGLFRDAVGLYLVKVAGALRSRLQIDAKKAQEDATLNDEEKGRLGVALKSAIDGVDVVNGLLSEGKLDEAAKKLSELGQALEQLREDPTVKGFLGGTPATPQQPAPVPTGLDLGEALGGFLVGLVPRSKRLSGLTAFIGKLDVIVLLLALVVSILLGLKLLWVDNATWGSANDYMVALLWGLGLHQIANASYEGLGGIVQKYTN